MNIFEHKPPVILVLGMHRSGTSLVAQLVSIWGAFTGNELVPPTSFNREGYWEYQPLVDFHEKILKESESSWYAPVNIPPTEKLLKRYGATARSLVEQMDQNGNAWCWKDPRMPLFLSFWQKILTDRKIVYVVVYRHPYSIASSLHKRDHFPVYTSTSLWELTSLHLFESLKNSTYCVVDYDETIFNPEKACKQLFSFLDQAAERNEKTEVVPEALKAVKPALNHERTGIQFNISEFQQQIVDGYLSGKFDQFTGISASHMEKLRQILQLFTKQKTGEHLAQLFFEDDSGRFSENNSIIRKIETDETKIKFVLSRPLETRQLRFDPLNDYALVRINAVRFYLQGTAADMKFDLSSNAVAVKNGEYLFSTGDPQILIQIEKPEIQPVDEIIFELEYLRTGKQVLPLLMKLKEKEIEDHLNAHTAEIKKLKINFRQKVDHQAALLEQLRNQQKSEQDQIAELRKHVDQLGTELAMIHSSRTFRYRRYLMLFLKPSGWKEVIAKYSSRSEHAQEIRLIQSGGYFDEAYYLKNNPDVKNHRISPAKHYLMFGGFENRDPSAAFSNAFYFEKNPDVLASRINPLVHFLKHGKNEGRLPLPPRAGTTATSKTANANNNIAANSDNAGKIPHFNPPANDYSLMVPFKCKLKEYGPAPQIAVICHLFYTDLLEEIKHYLQHIPFPFRLFITTDTEQKQARIEQFFTGWRDTCAVVKVVPNRGRDIAPKLLAWPEVYREYEFFLHIHSKKTVQEKVLSGWREYLYETLLGSEKVIKSIFESFSCDQKLGIIAPQHFQNVRHAIGWGYNYDEAENFARKQGISISKDGPVDFPSGSMFWGRSAALKPLLDSRLTFSDFPEESGQIDNTLSHVIERLFFFACEKAGFGWIKINSRFNKTEDERTLAVENLEHLRELITNVKGSLLNRGTENVPQDGVAQAETPVSAPLHERM
ncbi:MAG: rhamnan synthesis F family protein [Bacteroidales bacterium]